MPVELQALFVDLAIHVDGEVREPQQGLLEAHQSRFRAGRGADDHPAGEAQVAVGEGREDRATINFHRQAQQPVASQGRAGLEAQAGRIGVRADDAKAALRQRAAAQHEGDQRRVAAHHVVTPANRQLPTIRLFEPDESPLAQQHLGARHRVPRRRAGIEKVE